MVAFPVSSRRGLLAAAGLLGLAALLLPSQAHAQYITNSPDPFAGGVLSASFPSPQLYPVVGYVQTRTYTNVVETNNNVVGGNDVLDYNATAVTVTYSDPSLTTVQDILSVPGTFQVTVLGRTSPFQLGTFNYQFDSESFSSNSLGVSFVSQLFPGFNSGGTVSIAAGPGIGQYTINAPALFRTEYSLNGNPFVDQGVSTINVGTPTASVPEPGSVALLMGLGLSGIAFLRRRKTVDAAPSGA